jgi:bifunctional non-homologous end joining protein LigD
VISGRYSRAYTRNGFDWSDRYQTLLSAAARLGCRSAILDGEVIVQDERGISDFEALRSAIRWQPERLIFYAFDLLHLNGKDLRDDPLDSRRAKLKELVRANPESPLQFSEEFTEGGAAVPGMCRTWPRGDCFKAGVLAVPEWTQQDMAQDEMLYRERLPHHRHGS